MTSIDRLSGEVESLKRQVRQLATQSPLESSSVSNGRVRFIGGLLRVDSGGRVQIVGTLEVDGTTTVTGTFNVSGPFKLTGNGEITGFLKITGPTEINGATTINGNFWVNGYTRLANDIFLESGGRLVSGPLVIDRNGAYGGRVASSGSLLLDAGTAVVLGAPATVQGGLTAVGLITGTSMQSLSNINALGNITALGDIGGGSKSFWIDHPTKAGKQLRHGSLEGPEHGVFYRGVVEFDAHGEAVFALPEYFAALVLDDDVPTVQVTAIGRPFLTGADLVDDGQVTVYGDAGRSAHIIVTAARERFDVEPDRVPMEPIASDWTPPAEDEEGVTNDG
jgi:hypothetical protein